MADQASEQKKTEATSAAAEGAKPRKKAAAPAPSAGAPGLDLVLDVPVTLSVELGATRMRVREVLELAEGSVVELEKASGEPCDLMVNGRLIARGEVSVVDERLAVRVVEVLEPAKG